MIIAEFPSRAPARPLPVISDRPWNKRAIINYLGNQFDQFGCHSDWTGERGGRHKMISIRFSEGLTLEIWKTFFNLFSEVPQVLRQSNLTE